MEKIECVEEGTYGIPCTGDVTFEPDPYAEEIHDDMTPVWMCEAHRNESARDV